MKWLLNIGLFLYLFLFLGFNDVKIAPEFTRCVLVLKGPVSYSESFSLFQVQSINGLLVGHNIDADYPVRDGIYLIEATSKNKFYHKRIIVVSE